MCLSSARQSRQYTCWLLAVLVAVVCAGSLAASAQAAPAKVKKPKPEAEKKAPESEIAPLPPAPVEPPPVAVVAKPTPPVEVPPVQRNHSVNINPLGLAVGDYAVNYQWRFAASHALVGELTATWSTADDGTTRGFGGQVGYRYLSNGTQNSWMFGMMAGYDGGNTNVRTSATSGGLTVARIYDLPYTRWRVTGTVGRRWVFGPGLNVTARMGVGAGKRAYAQGGNAEANQQAATMEMVVNFLPVALDSEISLGWVF